MKPLVIGNKKFTNRFFLGTGKFASREQTKAALAASETELVTVALTRVHETNTANDSILGAIDRSKIEVMLNTSGGYAILAGNRKKDVAQFTLSDSRTPDEVYAAIRANGQEVVFKNWDKRI